MASAAWPIPQRRCSRPGSQPRARSRRAICRSWSKILRKLVRKPPPASRSQPSRAGFVSLIGFELLQRLVQAFLKLGCDLFARDAFGGKIACYLVEDLVHRLVLEMVRHQRRRVAGCGITAEAELSCGPEPEQLVGPGRGLEHELLVVDEFGLKALLALVERGHGQLHFVFADRDRTGWKRTSPWFKSGSFEASGGSQAPSSLLGCAHEVCAGRRAQDTGQLHASQFCQAGMFTTR